MSKRIVRAVLGTMPVVFLTFGLERLVLEQWPWWAHFAVAGVSAVLLLEWPWPWRKTVESAPPLGEKWIGEDETWARLTVYSALLREGEHWVQKGNLRDRTPAGNARMEWALHRFSRDYPQAVRRGDTEREFNAKVLSWWISMTVEKEARDG